MSRLDRRGLVFSATAAAITMPWTARAQTAGGAQAQHSDEMVRAFVAAAQRMRDKAVAAGDQPFGAIIVKGEQVVGWGPSRVVADRNPKAHAERVAIMDAQLRLASVDLSGTVMFSTSRPCPMCEEAAAVANIARMYWGPNAQDAGRPKRG